MRWKRNLAFNNDDGKKTIQKTIYKKLFTKIIYIKKNKIKTLTTIPSASGFFVSTSLSEIEIK